jgi:hypothetical protein
MQCHSKNSRAKPPPLFEHAYPKLLPAYCPMHLVVSNWFFVQVNFPMRAILSANPDLRIVSVACGHSHTLAIAETGSVWSCGRNGDGQ